MSKTILLVEDDRFLRMLLEMHLQQHGYQVKTASNGKEAQPLLDESIDLILTDLHMPVMDGLRLIEWLRAQPRWSSLPVLVLTAQGRDSALKDARAVGADDVILKPVDINTLIQSLETLLVPC